jgi:hypothetical protein
MFKCSNAFFSLLNVGRGVHNTCLICSLFSTFQLTWIRTGVVVPYLELLHDANIWKLMCDVDAIASPALHTFTSVIRA